MRRIFATIGITLAMLSQPVFASDPPAPQTPTAREQMVAVQVQVDAAGKVKSAQPLPDPAVAEAMSRVAGELAYKLPFAPAKKAGVAVASETVLYLALAIEPRGNGQFGIRLKQASNGPMVTQMGKINVPKYQERGDRGATLVVGVSLGADGVPNIDSFKSESVLMKSPSKFAEARYLDAIASSLRKTRFRVDTVDGAAIPTYVRLPYQFDGGGEKRDEKTGQPIGNARAPGVEERSDQAGVELPKVLFLPPPG